MLRTVGVPGLLGAALLLVWLVGWTLFGAHASGFHALVPVGLALIIVQGVRRVNAE
jgi:hypothetical protein